MAGIASARLDTELLLGHALKKPREYLLAHPETSLRKGPSFAQLDKWLERRAKREPLVYIIGEKEFYGRLFIVTPEVLIPRPESEAMIELVKKLPLRAGDLLADIGTGSGVLAITAKLEMPGLSVIATDNSRPALAIARKNARRHNAKLAFRAGDLLGGLSAPSPNVIMANLPYVDKSWQLSAETKYEPSGALFAEDGGLKLIKQLITQAPAKLSINGFLLLEADLRQHRLVIAFASKHRLKHLSTQSLILTFQIER